MVRPHGGPDAGRYRVDAPVAPQVAMHTVFGITASRRWTAATFDVSGAFLTGNDHLRKLFFRAPREGLPGVPPGCLIEIACSALRKLHACGCFEHVTSS